MTDAELLRYSRHVLLDESGVEGQQRILCSHALIIGAGGLGSPVALYLGSAGVGQITIVDHDTVDMTNLQRQIMHATASIGQAKALSAQIAIAAEQIAQSVTILFSEDLWSAEYGGKYQYSHAEGYHIPNAKPAEEDELK